MKTKLQPVWNATVTGYGPFPTDMLRYDACVPRNEWDSATIAELAQFRKRASVNVQGRGHNGPTHARWTSFGWSVTYLDFTILEFVPVGRND